MSDYNLNLTTYVGLYTSLYRDITGWVTNGVLEFRRLITDTGKIVISGSLNPHIDENGNIIIRQVSIESEACGVHRLLRLITIVHNWVRRGRHE